MANLANGKHQQLVLWGGDLVVTTQDVKTKRCFVPKGTEFRVEVGRNKIVAAPNERVTLSYPARRQKLGSFLWQAETVEVPAMHLQRVLKSSDYPTERGSSLSVLSECRGGLFSPK